MILAISNRHSDNKIIGYFTLQVQRQQIPELWESMIHWCSFHLLAVSLSGFTTFRGKIEATLSSVSCLGMKKILPEDHWMSSLFPKQWLVTRMKSAWLAQTNHLRINKCWQVNHGLAHCLEHGKYRVALFINQSLIQTYNAHLKFLICCTFLLSFT